jgi:hypothetical protein
MKKERKVTKYRRMIESLKKEFYGGNYEDFSCGNTMGLYVRNPYKCERIFDRFEKVKSEK